MTTSINKFDESIGIIYACENEDGVNKLVAIRDNLGYLERKVISFVNQIW